MLKYGETFYGRQTALNTRCSEVKEKSKSLSLETKNTQKSENRFYQVSSYATM